MGQDGPGVDEVVGRPGQPAGGDVEAGDVEVGGLDLLDEVGVEVDGTDATRPPHFRAQPPGDRAATGAHLQAVPAGTDSECLEPAGRARVVTRFDQAQAAPGVLPTVVEGIRLLFADVMVPAVWRRVDGGGRGFRRTDGCSSFSDWPPTILRTSFGVLTGSLLPSNQVIAAGQAGRPAEMDHGGHDIPGCLRCGRIPAF